MKIKEILEKRERLISKSNPEWQNIHELKLDVQKDFNNNESLSIPTFNKILDWKLQNQKSKIEKILNFSPDTLIKNITHCYYKTDHPDNEMKTRIKVQILLSIPWIGIGISSAIMALHEPQFYSTVDFRSWSVLFHKHKKTFSGNDYLRYLRSIRKLSDKVGFDVLEIDYIFCKQFET